MKLHMHNHTLVIYIQYKILEIPFIGYLVMAEDGAKPLTYRQSKDNNSSITDDTIKNLTCITTSWSYVFSISFMKFHSLVGTKLWFRTKSH